MTLDTTAWEFWATGTRWRIYHSGELDGWVAKSLAAAIELDEARWSRFRPESEISRLNRSTGEWCEVSVETFELLEACELWTRQTGGVFQPLVGKALAAWGYEHSISAQAPFAPLTPRGEALEGAINLDRARLRASVPMSTTIDIGGIGKSWIASRAASLATTLCDDQRLLIDAGGDLLAVTGEHVIAVEPATNGDAEVEAWIQLRPAQAIATSGFGRRSWTNGDGRTSHHLIDPDTGTPGPLTHATVVADDLVTADVNAKVLALRPRRIDTCPYAALVRSPECTLTNSSWRALALTHEPYRTRRGHR